MLTTAGSTSDFISGLSGSVYRGENDNVEGKLAFSDIQQGKLAAIRMQVDEECSEHREGAPLDKELNKYSTESRRPFDP